MDLTILEINKKEEYILLQSEKDQNLWPYILFDATFENGDKVYCSMLSCYYKEKTEEVKECA